MNCLAGPHLFSFARLAIVRTVAHRQDELFLIKLK